MSEHSKVTQGPECSSECSGKGMWCYEVAGKAKSGGDLKPPPLISLKTK